MCHKSVPSFSSQLAVLSSRLKTPLLLLLPGAPSLSRRFLARQGGVVNLLLLRRFLRNCLFLGRLFLCLRLCWRSFSRRFFGFRFLLWQLGRRELLPIKGDFSNAHSSERLTMPAQLLVLFLAFV